MALPRHVQDKRKRAPRISGPFPPRAGFGQLQLGHVGRLLALRPFHDIELNFLPFGQGLESVSLERRVVHKNIVAIRSRDESVALGVVEPLYGAFVSHVPFSLLSFQDPRRLPGGKVPSERDLNP